MNPFGIAGYLFHKPIRAGTMRQLDLPDACRRVGVDILELCSSFFPDQSSAYLNELRSAAEDAGVRIHNIAVDIGDISSADPARRRTDLEAIKQWFFTARAIGAGGIRVNSGGTESGDGDELERTIAAYRELAGEAERLGVYLLVENHGGASYNPELLEEILNGVASPWFGTCPDTGLYVDGTWRRGIEVMAPRAYSCHVKVTAYSEDGWQPRVGPDGRDRSADLKGILARLKANGYSGPLCVEVGVEDDEVEAAKGAISYLKRLMADID